MNQQCCSRCKYLKINEMSDEMYCKLKDYDLIRLGFRKHRPDWCPRLKWNMRGDSDDN
jgi:hypothetical protein